MQTPAQILVEKLTLIVDTCESLRDDVIAFWNAHKDEKPETIGKIAREEFKSLKFKTYDKGKTVDTILAEIMAGTKRFSKQEVSKFLKGLGYIADRAKNANSEGVLRKRAVDNAFGIVKPSPNKGKGKSKSKGSRPAINANMIVAWINEGNLTSKKDGQRIAKAIAEAFNA